MSQFSRNFLQFSRHFPAISPQFFAIGFDPPLPPDRNSPPPPMLMYLLRFGLPTAVLLSLAALRMTLPTDWGPTPLHHNPRSHNPESKPLDVPHHGRWCREPLIVEHCP